MTLDASVGGFTPNAYVTLVEADTYHTDRGNTFWTEETDDSLREAAIVKATGWIDSKFGKRFPGAKTEGRAQSLGWPRTGASDRDEEEIPSDEIPVEVKRATIEAAGYVLQDPDALTETFSAGGQIIREKLEGMETQFAEVSDSARSRWHTIEDILSPLILSPDGDIPAILVV